MRVELKREKESKNLLGLRNDLNKMNLHPEKVYIDGKSIEECIAKELGLPLSEKALDSCMFGCCSTVMVENDKDREKFLKALNAALDASGGSVFKAMQMVNQLAVFNDKEVSPDEEVEIFNKKYYISYAKKLAYDSKGNEVANCNEIPEAAREAMADEVTKALLIAKLTPKK